MDCSTAFTNKESPMHGDWDKEVETIGKLVDTAHETGVQVIYTHSYNKADDPALRIFAKKVPGMQALATDPNDIVLDKRIRTRKSDRTIYTKYYSVYSDSDLLPILRETSCDTLILCGFSTSGAIRAMATETIQHAIRPIIPAEAVGDRDEFVHRNNLADIDRKFGDVLPAGEVIRYLLSRKK
ncbi:isochorismatase family protein [Paenibacillus sp. sgz302251]|uniref:isochorismatase family protein n=1 Tax=Paenibacillus sp. sgz302251 TaxID=3414493 RepID=UPI003C7DC314